jgi:uncharacterized RDD family membrane protein YckC
MSLSPQQKETKDPGHPQQTPAGNGAIWRRHLAHLLDYAILVVPFGIIPLLYFHINQFSQALWWLFAFCFGYATLCFIEPVFLSLFGTTPGMHIFGISVRLSTGEKLTYKQALRRADWDVSLGCRSKSNSDDNRGESEKDVPCPRVAAGGSVVLLNAQRCRWYQPLLYTAVWAVLVFAMLLAAFVPRIPPNTGTLTVAQFAENYNYLAGYYKYSVGDSSLRLNDEGKWYVADSGDELYEIAIGDGRNETTLNDGSAPGVFMPLPPPTFRFETDADGNITSVMFTYTAVLFSDELVYFAYFDQLRIASLAVICAQKEYSVFSNTFSRIYVAVEGYENFTECGTDFAFDVRGNEITVTITP